MIKKLMSSPKTSIAGILGFIGVIVLAVRSVMDNDPATIPDWNEVILALNGLMVSLGLIAARDNTTTSEQAGIK